MSEAPGSHARTLVTAALPYANYKPHLGHVAGVYLPADIYTRYLRLLGEDALLVCGSDDHGVPITISAQAEEVTPEEITAKYRAVQREVFDGLGIEFDVYSGTSISPPHRELAQEFFTRIHERGDIEAKDTEQFFCGSCDRFLPDRYVEGTCPRCGSEGARGDQCDACGNGFEQTELGAPRCATCGSAPEARTTRHWFFRLDHYEEQLREWLEGREGWRENVRNFALGVVKGGLPGRSITRDLTWGVPVPLEEAAGKVLYVWFDAPIGYISFTREWAEAQGDPEAWRPYWQAPDTRIVHFLGKDNIIFHAVIWPAMLMAHGEYQLPAEIPANEYLNFAGEKFSKSRGVGVWVDEILALYPADRVRYYLAAIAPEGKDANFSWEEFVQRNNDELSDVVGNLGHRVLTFTGKYYDGAVPPGGAGGELMTELLPTIAEHRDRWRSALGRYRLREALGVAVDLARVGNRAFDAAEPWKRRKEDPERCGRDLAALLELVRAVAGLLSPFIPESAARLWAAFGEGGAGPTPGEIAGLGRDTLEAGTPLAPPGIIFPRLELAEE